MLSLPKDAKGTYLIVTENGSRYLVDLDSSTVIREPDPNQPHVHLRRDAETLPLLERPHIRVGEPAFFVLAGLREGAFTPRQTSYVTAIEQAGPASEHSP